MELCASDCGHERVGVRPGNWPGNRRKSTDLLDIGRAARSHRCSEHRSRCPTPVGGFRRRRSAAPARASVQMSVLGGSEALGLMDTAQVMVEDIELLPLKSGISRWFLRSSEVGVSTKRTSAPGAMVCAHSTSRVASPAQPSPIVGGQRTAGPPPQAGSPSKRGSGQVEALSKMVRSWPIVGESERDRR